MSKRPAVTQATLERLIRAAKAQGLPVVRITATAEGVTIETMDNAPPVNSANARFNEWLAKRSKEHARAG